MIQKKWFSWAAIAIAALSVVACGSGSGSGSTTLRLVNVSNAYPSLDLYAGGAKEISSVASGTASAYATISSGAYTTELTNAGSTTTLVSLSATLAGSTAYTLLAYGDSGNLRNILLADSQPVPTTTGFGELRVINTAASAGTLDVYLTPAGATSLANAAVLATGVGVGSQSGYITEGKGSFDIWVTGYGDTTDVRLHLNSIALADQEIATLILTPTTGGVLVNGAWLDQGGSLTTYQNTSARMRLVAGVTDNKTVAATVGATVLSSGVVAPTVGSYALVPAGSYTPTITVNGTPVSSSLSLTAGTDYSLLIYGLASAPQVNLLADDNSYPVDTTKARFRLVHAAYDDRSSQLSLSADFSYLVTNVVYGNASAYSNLTGGTVGDLSVVSTSGSTVFQKNPSAGINITARGIYTVWMLGNNTGVLLKDR